MMTRYRCTVCGYTHGESPAGERWEDLPDDWTCPVCGAAKSAFQPVESDASGAADSADGVAVPASRAVLAHRVFGYAFLAIYVILMIQMVPRLWTYQIEFPARTVVHLSLGMAIGVVLLLKISVVRFFRRLDQSLVPSLGTFLLVGSVVLIGISVPAAFREAAATSGLLSETNRQRVGALLAQTGLEPKECTRLTTPESLREGQRILRQECIDCHDLRTVLAKPRTPENWRQTVRRMAERTTMMNPLEEDEQWAVTAYLVALSPDLQKSLQQLRDQQDRRSQSQEEAATMTMQEAEPNGYEPDRAKRLFDNKCTQCHGLDVVESSPPADETAARELVSRMVDEGLEATPAELTQIVLYLTATYGQASE